VRLRSADPNDRLIVDMRFLSYPDDVAKLERSIEIARAAAHSPALKPFVVREVAPGRTLKGQELANFRPRRGDDLLPLIRGLPDG
jgi:choline dehydrogenase